MRLVCHRSVPADIDLKSQWNGLVQQMERPEVFYTYEWAGAVHRAYEAEVNPLLILAYEADSLIGVASLATDLRQKKVFFLAETTADYCDFVSAPACRQEFVDAVLAELRKTKHAKMVFANVPSDSRTWAVLKETHVSFFSRAGSFIFARPAYSCSQVAIEDEESAKTVQNSARKRLQRFRKALPSAEQVSVRHSRSTDEIEQEFHDFVTAHIGRFLATGRMSNLVTAARRTFLLELAKTLAKSGSVVLSRLLVGERPIAWNYGFQFSGSYFWYQPTFDGEFQVYSPGLWLLSAIVEESCEEVDITRIDLGLGAEDYKERLANGARQTMHITMSASPAIYAGAALRYATATIIKSRPRWEKFIRNALRVFANFKSPKNAESSARLYDISKVSDRRSEIVFLEWNGTGKLRPNISIRPIDLTLLAGLAMQHEHDQQALDYILRAAKHLRLTNASGIALFSGPGKAECLCWTRDFDANVFEAKKEVFDRTQNNILIFDSWVIEKRLPANGCLDPLSIIATYLAAAGASPWAIAFDAGTAANLEAAGFCRRFSARCNDPLVRKLFADMKSPATDREHRVKFAAA